VRLGAGFWEPSGRCWVKTLWARRQRRGGSLAGGRRAGITGAGYGTPHAARCRKVFLGADDPFHISQPYIILDRTDALLRTGSETGRTTPNHLYHSPSISTSTRGTSLSLRSVSNMF
jgi:hypothetical protein